MKQLRPLQLEGSRKARRTQNVVKKLLPLTMVVGILILIAIFLVTRSGTTSYVSYVNTILSGTSLDSSLGQVNILFLGTAGGKHAGSNLTDTIMVASYNLKTNNVHLFSIPRDLWLPSLKTKANAVYSVGQAQDNGLGLAKTVMGNVLGLPIHYSLRVDFNGFVKAVDALGGIEVEVEDPFDDYLYPIQGAENDLCGNSEQEKDFNEEEAKNLNIEPGKRKVLITADGKIATDAAEEDKGIKYYSCRYEHIRFDEGMVKMNGAIALSFVRSRHGTNGQGSDFARAKRQQKVLEAIKGKVLSLETLVNAQKITELIKTLGSSVDTDISVKDGIEFYKLSKKLEKTYNFVLDDSRIEGLPDNKSSLLVNPGRDEYGGAYVLVSQDDDFSSIQEYVKKILEEELMNEDATTAARPRNSGF